VSNIALQQQIAIIMEIRRGEKKIVRLQIRSRNKKKVISFIYKKEWKENLKEKLG